MVSDEQVVPLLLGQVDFGRAPSIENRTLLISFPGTQIPLSAGMALKLAVSSATCMIPDVSMSVVSTGR